MIRRLIFLVLMGCYGFASAQFVPGQGEDRINVSPNIAPQKTILKISLLSPFEVPKSVRVSLEVTLNKTLSLEPEIGYIYNYSAGVSKIDDHILNMEQRLALRYYPAEDLVNGLYLSPMVSFSSFNYQQGLWRNLIPNQPDNTWFLDYSNASTFQQTNISLYGLVGLQPVLFRHFTFDLNGGIGIRYQTIITKFDQALVNGAKVPAPVSTFIPEGLFSLRVGYVF